MLRVMKKNWLDSKYIEAWMLTYKIISSISFEKSRVIKRGITLLLYRNEMLISLNTHVKDIIAIMNRKIIRNDTCTTIDIKRDT